MHVRLDIHQGKIFWSELNSPQGMEKKYHH